MTSNRAPGAFRRETDPQHHCSATMLNSGHRQLSHMLIPFFTLNQHGLFVAETFNVIAAQ